MTTTKGKSLIMKYLHFIPKVPIHNVFSLKLLSMEKLHAHGTYEIIPTVCTNFNPEQRGLGGKEGEINHSR